jgi:hypothetical protein
MYGYRCIAEEHGLKIYYSKKKLKRCSYGCGRRPFRWTDTEIRPRYDKIAIEVRRVLKRNGIRSKLVRGMKIYSKKYDFILAKHKDTDVFLFFNKNGISKRTEEDFLIDARPFVLLNFSGELKSTLEDYGHLSGGVVLRLAMGGNLAPLLECMDEALKKYKAGASSSLGISVNKLKEIRDHNADAALKPAEKGTMFEKLVRPCFSLLFNAKSLSSRNRPDGVFFLNQNDYIIWDAKRYDSDKSTLIKNVKKSDTRLPKDIKYIKKAVTLDKLLKRNLRFYMYVTKSISKSDFHAAKAELEKRGKKTGIKINVVCLNLKGLIALGESINMPNVFENIIKERERFISEFNDLLSSNDFLGEVEIKGLVDKFEKPSIEPKLETDTFTAS